MYFFNWLLAKNKVKADLVIVIRAFQNTEILAVQKQQENNRGVLLSVTEEIS